MVTIKLEGLSSYQRRRALKSVYDACPDGQYTSDRKAVHGGAITIQDKGDHVEVHSGCYSSESSLYDYLPRGYDRFQAQS